MEGWGDKLERPNSSGMPVREFIFQMCSCIHDCLAGDNVTVSDATPAMLIALALFALPSEPHFWKSLWSKDGTYAPKSAPPLLR